MRGELFAVDLETTGFNPVDDEIIEVAAVRVVDGQVVDRFQSFVNPGRPIPEPISALTGIRDEDVRGAPGVNRVMPMLNAFVGGGLWIAHNVSFDHSFLRRRGALENNPRLDTFDLASILIPRAARYSLQSLVALMGLRIDHAHRAEFDARATAALYTMLWERACALSPALLQEIIDLSGDLPWDSRKFFQAALNEQRQARRSEPAPARSHLPFSPAPERPPLSQTDDNRPVDRQDIADVLGPGGALAAALPGYEYRPQQLEMAYRVHDALKHDQHLLIEASTGTGKSLAYLVPSVLWAAASGERVVISTNTINLQEQLFHKDIPLLKAALPIPFEAAVMKGRGNYLCPRRLNAARRRRPTSVDELRTIAKILVWLTESASGDRGEISLRGDEFSIWSRLSAEDEGCHDDMCQTLMQGTCPFYRARQAARAAHIVIVNHALLVSDALADNRVLPEFSRVIIDEAHNLEDAVTSGLSFRLDEGILRRRLSDLGGLKTGLLGSLLASLDASQAPEKTRLRIREFIGDLSAATGKMEVHITRLFEALRDLARAFHPGRGDYAPQLRIVDAVRQHGHFNSLQARWETLRQFFLVISERIRDLANYMPRLEAYHLADFGDLRSSVDAAAAFLTETFHQLEHFFSAPDPNTVYWLALGQSDSYVSLNSAPLHVGRLIEQSLWGAKASVVLTSATLRTIGGFEYLQTRLNGAGIATAEVGSPFDYRSSTLIYLPTDIPDPIRYEPSYQRAVERGIVALADALRGRILVLFTSYKQLRQTAQAITPRLALGSIPVFDQSDGSSRQALLDGFAASERAVLLGTKSFWEGVDLPGDALIGLVIAKLPFATPTEPIVAARMETFADSFNDYQLPEAVLRFRQGFGRLIRTRSDRGVVAVFDPRVLTKSYGGEFLAALPDCTQVRGPLADLPVHAAAWMSENTNRSQAIP